MTAQADPYVRVYYRISTDEKFRAVYRDDALLGCWLKLLIIADAMHPAPAHLPYGVDLARVKALAEAGLIDIVQEGMYVIHGLASERTKRSDSARDNANKRWQKPPDATAMRPHSGSDATAVLSAPILSEPSLSEPLLAAPGEQDGDVLDVWYRLTASWPSDKIAPWLTQLAEAYGDEETGKALAAEWMAKPDRATVVGRTRDRLAKAVHDRTKAYEKRAAEVAQEERRKMSEQMTDEQLAENRERLRQAMIDSGLISGKR